MDAPEPAAKRPQRAAAAAATSLSSKLLGLKGASFAPAVGAFWGQELTWPSPPLAALYPKGKPDCIEVVASDLFHLQVSARTRSSRLHTCC